MAPSQGQLLDEILGLREQVEVMRSEMMTHEIMGAAVKTGILAAVSDPHMWHSAMLAMQARAKAEAGGWLFGGLRVALSKLAWIIVIVTGIYLLGGWAAVVTFFKTHV